MRQIFVAVVFLFVCLVSSYYDAYAQSRSIAFRQGAGLWLTRNGLGKKTLHYPEGQHFTWNKELVYQITSAGKWAGEIGVSHYKMERTSYWSEGLTDYTRKSTSQYFEMPFSIQYDVTCPLLAKFLPQFPKSKSYIGIIGVPCISFEHVDKDAKVDYGRSFRYSWRENDMSFMVGFLYRHQMPVTKRLSLSSEFTFRMDPFHAHLIKTSGAVMPNRNITVQTGLSYRIN